MTLYTADVTYTMPEYQVYQVDADDAEDAEFQILDLVKEDYPEATSYMVDNIQKVV